MSYMVNPIAGVATKITAPKKKMNQGQIDEVAQVMGTFRDATSKKSSEIQEKAKTSSPIERRLQAKSAPLVGAPAAAPKPAVASARVREEFNAKVDPRFATLRERATAASNSATQGDVEAIKRRFAAAGALNSGEAMKIEQQARERGAELARASQQDIDMAEVGDLAAQREAFEGRQFAREQTDVANQFAATEAKKVRKLQENLAAKDMKFKKFVASAEFKNKAKELNIAKEYLKIDKEVTKANMDLAKEMANKKGFLDNFMGSMGGDFLKNALTPGGGLKNATMGSSYVTDNASKLDPTQW